jgi:hypothetical protein
MEDEISGEAQASPSVTCGAAKSSRDSTLASLYHPSIEIQRRAKPGLAEE